MNSNITTSLLTKTELEWLLGNLQLSASCHRKIKSQIRKTINNFEKFELPLLIEKGLMSFSSVTKCGNGVTNIVTQKFILPHQTMKIVLKWKALSGIWSRDLFLTKETLYQAELPRHKGSCNTVLIIVTLNLAGII